MTQPAPGDYVLVTPAYNEARSIRRTLESVVGQTHLPREWIVVSDGSTDGTDAVIGEYAAAFDFIRFLRRGRNGPSNFASKVHAFDLGHRSLTFPAYGFVGNLDADVSFGPDYFERLLRMFDGRPELGIAGGAVFERIGGRFVRHRSSTNSVPGMVQMFRRRCFEDIGGYIPIAGGGEDAAAVILARHLGWTVETSVDFVVYHDGPVLCGARTLLGARFARGATNHELGYHPLFQALSCCWRIAEQPYVLGSCLAGLGYLWSTVRRPAPALPGEVVAALRTDQLRRLRPVRW